MAALIAFITGLFKEFILFSSIIIIHELGHVLAGIICKWKISKVIILPFGGLTIFEEKINHSLSKELFIVLMGPLFQIVFAYLINDSILLHYHYAILFFNLLPIYPLDGSKIINILFNNFFSFKRSQQLGIIISYILLIGLFFVKRLNLLYLLILFFLLKKVIFEHFNLSNVFNKFLLERYLYQFNFKKVKKIKKIKDMRLNRKHLFNIDKKWYTEKEILNKMFDK